MRRRIVISVSIVASFTLAIFIGGWFIQASPRINRESFARIEGGMTQCEVEEIIGAPPGDYGTGTGYYDAISRSDGTLMSSIIKSRSVEKKWLGQERGISVWFDADGRACWMSLSPVFRRYESNTQRFLGWIGLVEGKQIPLFAE